ncbi:Cell division suppressor protein YneA [Metalysinibacillus saudimassiliensis]|uniref:Cell division suppressor protein YneA n=1 Tax=Metalysinibacillus saudimassiliensis TaxID=1461583 RepID=A0A078MEH5_9BACL|nr:Cell division suppressor protein YneA [Metalysinibacillus saudimassiliensis]
MSERQIKKEILLLLMSVILVVMYVVWSFKSISYGEIKIEQGDSLVTLAEQYKGAMSTTKWVDVVRTENNIHDDTIIAGKTLVIPIAQNKEQLASDQ